MTTDHCRPMPDDQELFRLLQEIGANGADRDREILEIIYRHLRAALRPWLRARFEQLRRRLSA